MSIDVPSKGTEPADGTGTATGGAAPETTKAGLWSALRPLVLRLHFYAGLLIAPLLLAAAVSGFLYALSHQAEKLVYSRELQVPTGESSVPLSAQVEAARTAHPEGEVTAVWPSHEDGATTRVLMTTPEVEEGESLAVFVNPYTGEIRGELVDSFGALPLRAWLSGLHSNLHMGDFGRNYSEMAASWLWVVALGGLLLWLGRRRRSKRELILPERGATGRRKTLTRHGAVGVWAVAGLLVLSATGLTWSKYAGENIDTLQTQLGGATPSVAAELSPGGGEGDGHEGHGGGGDSVAQQGPDVGIDKVVEAAAAKGVEGQISVILPADGSGYVVKETDKQFPVHLDSVAVHPADGKVMDELRFADYPLLAKLTRFGIDVHMGVTFGLANQLALAALALALILLIVWGYRMWWLRRPTKERKLSAGRPMPRGAWRKLPATALLPVAAVTVVVGWFIPMLGISLLAFLVIDIALGVTAKARAKA
ncbi:PepSY domain-containing protein [Streptomyces sp. NBC_00390]|uniref:PepSY-associated TM helix domain-containing protein n=1 Tax=Streptomyces sp. NBC_00390 TaxID=2975736 RepID=UPI002E1C7652